jgi:hypothetical protein
MAFCIKPDYLDFSREDNVNVLTGSNDIRLSDVEESVIQEIASYLNTRYDISKSFPDVNFYAIATGYKKDDLVYLTASPWSAIAYAIGDLVSYLGKVFKCIAITTNEPTTNAAFWTEWGANNKFYSVVADVTAGTALTDATKYLIGDTRVAMLKRLVIDLVLYELHARINPRNIPDFRVERRDKGIEWLKLVSNAKNNINAEFLTLRTFESENGERKSNNMSWNSKGKRKNYY